MPSNGIHSIAFDGSGNKWIGTYGGLAKFDSTNWVVYNTSNSGLPNNSIRSIAIDGSGNKWIGTVNGGLAVYNKGGIVAIKDIKKSFSKTGYKIVLHQSYPITRISYSISKPVHIVLTVFDIRLLKNLVNTIKRAGNHHVNFDCRNIPNGAYFVNLRGGNITASKKMVVLK